MSPSPFSKMASPVKTNVLAPHHGGAGAFSTRVPMVKKIAVLQRDKILPSVLCNPSVEYLSDLTESMNLAALPLTFRKKKDSTDNWTDQR